VLGEWEGRAPTPGMIHPSAFVHADDPRAYSPEPHSDAPKTDSVRSESRAASRRRESRAASRESGARTPACNLVQIELVVNSGTSRRHPAQVTQQSSLDSQDDVGGVMKRAAPASDSSSPRAGPEDKDDKERSLRAIVATGLSLERSNDGTKRPSKTQGIWRAIDAQHSFISSTQPSVIGEDFRDETPDSAPDEPPRSLNRQRGSMAHQDTSVRLPGTGGTQAGPFLLLQ
jgi:hypothetical protein